jgi:hypothetical protein
MRLLAIGDLHLSSPLNREALFDIPDHGDDWLIIAGDVAESFEHQELALRELGKRFSKLIWVPGNHDLWSIPRDGIELEVGVARYRALVELARAHGALTPEDPYIDWPRPMPGGGRMPNGIDKSLADARRSDHNSAGAPFHAVVWHGVNE